MVAALAVVRLSIQPHSLRVDAGPLAFADLHVDVVDEPTITAACGDRERLEAADVDCGLHARRAAALGTRHEVEGGSALGALHPESLGSTRLGVLQCASLGTNVHLDLLRLLRLGGLRLGLGAIDHPEAHSALSTALATRVVRHPLA